MDEKRNSKHSEESRRLESLYRKASDPVLRTHLLMVWRMSVGDSVGEVAEMVEFLPTGSPELQPAERLWPLTNEAISNCLFEEIEQMEEALVERCVQLLAQSGTIRDLTNYHWWPQSA